jgi:hypothetical protein
VPNTDSIALLSLSLKAPNQKDQEKWSLGRCRITYHTAFVAPNSDDVRIDEARKGVSMTFSLSNLPLTLTEMTVDNDGPTGRRIFEQNLRLCLPGLTTPSSSGTIYRAGTRRAISGQNSGVCWGSDPRRTTRPISYRAEGRLHHRLRVVYVGLDYVQEL